MLNRYVKTITIWSRSPSQTIGGAAFLIASAGIVSRLLGFFRDRVFASSFGAGDVLDAYYAAFRIPDTLYSFLVLGSLSVALIPVFTEYMTAKKEQEAWQLVSGLLSALLLILGVVSLIGMIFTPIMIRVMVPGFSVEKQELVVTLTRIMLLSPIFLAISALFGSVLVSFKHFLAYSLAPIVYNIGIIVGAILLVPFFGSVGLAWGVVLGSILHMMIQYPSFRRSGFRYTLALPLIWREKSVRRVIKLMIPRSLGMGINQISFLVVTFFASTLVSGSLSAFTLANNIQSVPLGLFGIAFSIAVFPSLSLLVAEKKEKDFFRVFTASARRIVFFVLPISIFMIIFRAQFVRVILGSGSFNWEDTIVTFEILKFLAMSLFAQSLIPLFARAFFAFQNTMTPLYIAMVSEAVHVLLIALLLPKYGVFSLAIAFSLSTTLNFLLLYAMLRKQLSTWNDRLFTWPLIKVLIASGLAGGVAQFSKSVFALTTNELDTFIEVFLQLVTGLTIGGVTFILLCHWFKIEELSMIKRFFLCKVLRYPETAVLAEDHPERGDW
ncbi:MAG: murein biosynthesis integral membrane protein MurJ [Minisyncoccota bacterium]